MPRKDGATTLGMNPYPDEWTMLTGFEYLSAMSLIRPLNTVRDRMGADGDYALHHDFACCVDVDGEALGLTAPRGMVTDLTSVPGPLRPFVGRVGPWLEAAVLHDWLYVAWRLVPGRGARPRDRLFADRVMLLAMKRAQVSRWRRWTIYAAVRLFGGPSYRSGDIRFVDLGERAMSTALLIPARS